jgi:hypothetical protein
VELITAVAGVPRCYTIPNTMAARNAKDMIAAAMFSLSRSCIETSYTDLHLRLATAPQGTHEQTVRFRKDAWQAEKFPQRKKNYFVLKCIYVSTCAEFATSAVVRVINHKTI